MVILRIMVQKQDIKEIKWVSRDKQLAESCCMPSKIMKFSFIQLYTKLCFVKK